MPEGANLELSLRFTDNGRLHDDVELRIDGETVLCDSYYFATDDDLLPGQKDGPKIRAVLRRLLEQWMAAVQNLPDDGVAFLPYNFSDEYTGWLRCTRAGVQVGVCRGLAPVNGYALAPCDVGELLSSLPGFSPEGPTVYTTVASLLDAIQRSMHDL